MLAIYCRTSRYQAGEIHTIEQQKEAGIKFAESKGLTYKIFEDENVSGYKIYENEEDYDNHEPYSNRESFNSLMSIIKHSKNLKKEERIDSVWVWELSRLSRNEYASGIIFHTFKTHKINLYVKTELIDLNDPSKKMMNSIMAAFAEYEREMIVARTTRGLHNAIDNGNRGFRKFFGYNYTKGVKERTINEKEMHLVREAYRMYLDGKSLAYIVNQFYKDKIFNQKEALYYSTKFNRIMAHAAYTGYSLTTEGLAILHRFERKEIDNIDCLTDPKYWYPSNCYKEQIISIEDWVKVRERLQVAKLARHSYNKDSVMGTGIVKCAYCGNGYYIYRTKQPNGKYYPCYKHRTLLTAGRAAPKCEQHPITFSQPKGDNIFTFFYITWQILYGVEKADITAEIEELKEKIKIQEDIYKTIDKKIKSKQRTIDKLAETMDNYSDDTERFNSVLDLRLKEEANLRDLQKEAKAEYGSYLEMKDLLTKDQERISFKGKVEKIINFITIDDVLSRRKELLNTIETGVIKEYNIILNGLTFDLRQDWSITPEALIAISENLEELFNSDDKATTLSKYLGIRLFSILPKANKKSKK